MGPRKSWSVCLASVFVLALPLFTHATGYGPPWENPIPSPAQVLTGPVLQGLIMSSIMINGLVIAFTAPRPFWRRINGFILWLSLMVGVATIGATLLPHSYIDPAAGYLLYAVPVIAVGLFGAVVGCVFTALFGKGRDAEGKDADGT